MLTAAPCCTRATAARRGRCSRATSRCWSATNNAGRARAALTCAPPASRRASPARTSVFRTTAAARLAAAARGAGAAAPHGSGAPAGARAASSGWTAAELARGDDERDDLALRLREWVAGARRARGRGAVRGGVADAAAAASGCSARSAASGSSPICGTSPRRCTRPRCEGPLGLTACCAWLRGVGRRPSATPWSNAADGWTPTPPRCRSSPCTPARAWSSRSSTCRSRGTTGRAASPRPPCSTTTTAAGCATSAAAAAPDWDAHVSEHKREETGEELRLLYVALTRAQSQLVLWWAPTPTPRPRRCTGCCCTTTPTTVAPTAIDGARRTRRRCARCGARAAASDGGLAVEVGRRRAATGVVTARRRRDVPCAAAVSTAGSTSAGAAPPTPR